MNIFSKTQDSPTNRRSILLASLVAVSMPVVAYDEPPPWLMPQHTWYTKIHRYTLVYYRAPQHANPPLNELDPYDSFQKDEHGNLLITETPKAIHSTYAGGDYRGYELKTRHGIPIAVYQITPTRREQTKSNCHGLTFLAGDYWLLSDQVAHIIDGNHWTLVPQEEVAPGDVAVFRERRGVIVHTARVVGRDEQNYILVDSKDGFDREQHGVRVNTIVP